GQYGEEGPAALRERSLTPPAAAASGLTAGPSTTRLTPAVRPAGSCTSPPARLGSSPRTQPTRRRTEAPHPVRGPALYRRLPRRARIVCLVAANPAAAADAPKGKKSAPNLVRSARSGPWSAPATWEGGRVPAGGDKVQVRIGHTIVYDVRSEQVIRSLHIG